LNKNISEKDKKDWQDFIDGKEKLKNKDINYNNRVNLQKNLSIDLHGYTLSEANEKIKKVIINSYNSGVKKILVVTGKGLHSQNEKDPYVSKDLSILKYSVPNFIEKNMELKNLITDMKEANLEDGGSGAFYIYLKKK
tara:strand:- start:131 stop:544 length:414 start_codon:yes stop_codon:yes gene_type:complete